MMKAIIQGALRRLGYEIRGLEPMRSYVSGLAHSRIHIDATYSPWLDDTAFQAVYAAISSNTLVDRYRCYELWQLVSEAAKLDHGDIIEVGAFRGGSGCLIAARSAQLGLPATVYLCDTFQGVVKATDRDPCYQGGEHSDTSRERVLALAEKLHVPNVDVLQGVFPDETGKLIEGRKFRFCHIDVDTYQSARDIAEWIWNRMVTGSITVYDDYGFNGAEGVTQFVNEERAKRGRIVMHNLNGHAVVVKAA